MLPDSGTNTGKSSEKRDAACDGSFRCVAELHIHGCFADRGNCDMPDEYHGEDDPEDLTLTGIERMWRP